MCVHVYYGFGKGKTCSAIGQTIRMIGHGRKALFCQFLKDGSSGEVKILMDNGIDYISPKNYLDSASNAGLFMLVMKLTIVNKYDIIVLDEILDVIVGEGIQKSLLVDFISMCNAKGIELIITGHYTPPDQIEGMADYLTYFEKMRHPYDHGVVAREGVEF